MTAKTIDIEALKNKSPEAIRTELKANGHTEALITQVIDLAAGKHHFYDEIQGVDASGKVVEVNGKPTT